jgi:hypothetical protein
MSRSFFATKRRLQASLVAQSVPCTTCGALANEPCITEGGHLARARWRPTSHVARRQAAEQRIVVTQFVTGTLPARGADAAVA